ncbi:hypothetical protein BT67DRAFT_51853 [Trichocladium antarcticum]|uniref:Uncharacterized protein n=1 Tax=Trichocladium antarcticum TaxID=1450529 RepID=A0AAN6UIX5_9PEZI|nr:hypothetical protein BT67DRAFT_51853 [Trichocladium antarcticum]
MFGNVQITMNWRSYKTGVLSLVLRRLLSKQKPSSHHHPPARPYLPNPTGYRFYNSHATFIQDASTPREKQGQSSPMAEPSTLLMLNPSLLRRSSTSGCPCGYAAAANSPATLLPRSSARSPTASMLSIENTATWSRSWSAHDMRLPPHPPPRARPRRAARNRHHSRGAGPWSCGTRFRALGHARSPRARSVTHSVPFFSLFPPRSFGAALSGCGRPVDMIDLRHRRRFRSTPIFLAFGTVSALLWVIFAVVLA